MESTCGDRVGSQLKEVSALFRVDDRRMEFAIDMASGNIYRDTPRAK